MSRIQVFIHIRSADDTSAELMDHIDWLPFGNETSVGEWTHTFVCDESEPFINGNVTHWDADWYRENFDVLERGSGAELALTTEMLAEATEAFNRVSGETEAHETAVINAVDDCVPEWFDAIDRRTLAEARKRSRGSHA